jgi:hypothetical protein
MQLTDEQLREILARAEEIQRATRQREEQNTELAVLLETATEMGLSRLAVERALRERLDLVLSVAPPAAGERVFARSADGNFYTAEVRSVSADGAHVWFLRGGEHWVPLDHLRPFSLIPGEKVVVNWPWWGPWTCTVVGYDPARQRVEVTDGWSNESFPVGEIWLRPPKPPSSRARIWAVVGVSTAVGALLGTIVTALLQ